MRSNNSNGSRAVSARGIMALCAMLTMGLGLSAWPAEAAPFAYVANEGSNNVSVIDTATNKVVATVPLGKHRPFWVAITPDGKHAYAANVNDSFPSTISVIDTATNMVVATVPVAAGVEEIAITPDGKHAYVPNGGTAGPGPGSGTVSVIDTAANKVVATFTVGNFPNGVAITPDGKHAYVTNFVPSNIGTVVVIDTVTNTVAATVPVGVDPIGVAITPDGKHAYVTTGSFFAPGTVAVIDTASNKVVATIPVGSESVGVAITPDGTHAYVADRTSDNVSVIDTASNTVVATVAVGFLPNGVAITPDGQHAYVPNGGTAGPGTVSVIATASNTVVATVAVGDGPAGVGIGSPPLAPCGSEDAALVNKKFPPGQLTYDVSSPTRTLQSIKLTSSSNIGSFTLPAVVSGGHSATGGVFNKADPAKSATFELAATFVSPAFACSIDPLTTTLKINTGHKVVQAFERVPDSEHFVEIDNGHPGLRWLRIEVNGKYARALSLHSGRRVHVDLSESMTLEQNTLTFTGEGKTGSFANINVSDSAPSKPASNRPASASASRSIQETGTWGHLMFEKEVP